MNRPGIVRLSAVHLNGLVMEEEMLGLRTEHLTSLFERARSRSSLSRRLLLVPVLARGLEGRYVIGDSRTWLL